MKRYRPVGVYSETKGEYADCVESPNGEWVRFEDVEHLERKLEALRFSIIALERDELQAKLAIAIEALRQVMNECGKGCAADGEFYAREALAKFGGEP